VRIALGTVEVSDRDRRAIAEHYGLDGLADRTTCRRFIISCGMEDDLFYYGSDDEEAL
jgi:hypothetical protein